MVKPFLRQKLLESHEFFFKDHNLNGLTHLGDCTSLLARGLSLRMTNLSLDVFQTLPTLVFFRF